MIWDNNGKRLLFVYEHISRSFFHSFFYLTFFFIHDESRKKTCTCMACSRSKEIIYNDFICGLCKHYNFPNNKNIAFSNVYMYVHVCLCIECQRAKEEGNTFTFKKYDKNSCLVNLQCVVCLPISMRMFKNILFILILQLDSQFS